MSPTANPDLDALPGHHIRRLQQIAVALFLQETQEHDVTPVQYAALRTVASQPGIDQRSLAALVGLDTSTLCGVVDRLHQRGLLQKITSEQDRRMHALAANAKGRALLAAVEPGMLRAQQRILAPLRNKAERAEFMRLLRVLVDGNNEASRAPSNAPAATAGNAKLLTAAATSSPTVSLRRRARVGTAARSIDS